MRIYFAKILLVSLISLVILPEGKSQGEESDGRWERIFFGGNFGLSIGNTTSIIVSPLAGYRVTPKLSVGTGIRYEYYKSNYNGYVPYDTHIYGGSVFSRYMLVPDISEAIGIGGLNSGIFLQGEYELLSLESQYFDHRNLSAGKRFVQHSVLVGGGLYQPIGPRSGLVLTVLWNLNESYNSLYSNPVIRIGFNF